MAQDGIMGFFGRHFVSIAWVDRTPGSRAVANNGVGTVVNISAFVISVRGEWFLVTAGHIIEDLKAAKSRGQVLTGFQLRDFWASNTVNRMPIPIDSDYLVSRSQSLYDANLGIDCACIHLNAYYRKLMQANGIVALSEFAWQRELPETPDFHIMLGVPSQLSRVESQGDCPSQRLNFVLIPVRPVQELPEQQRGLPHRFYGHLDEHLHCPDGTPLDDIDGMSGGPIIAFKYNEQGKLRYWVVAIQSSWLPSKRIVIGFPVIELGNAIREVVIPLIRGDRPDS